MIPRKAENTLLEMAKGYYVLVVTGPRQSGKTTLVRHLFRDKEYVTLEDPDEREFAEQDPKRFLARFPDGAVLDEVQRCPDLFSYLQGRVDQDRIPGQFVLTGSQQFGLISRITQSLAGRAGLLELLPFSLAELREAGCDPVTVDELLFNGLYPPLYDRPLLPTNWYKSYVLTYVERDVRQILAVKDLSCFQRFIRMCAARTGQLLNLSNMAGDCGITHNTAKAWISVLEASYIIFLLRPHFSNYNKRLVKTPKLYFADTGLAAWLLGIRDTDQLSIHPSRGPLFENWVIIELTKILYNQGRESNLFFWRDNSGNEIDVIRDCETRLFPVEIKSGQTVRQEAFAGLKKWLTLAGDDAGTAALCYGGNDAYVRSGVSVIPWQEIERIPGLQNNEQAG
jgi:predicted AAA+ superfamily ATPase